MSLAVDSNSLTKNFKSFHKRPGFIGSLQSFIKRDYEIKKAVSGFDLQIERGEIIGLLGPNGAGKTTLMKMFTGIIVPSSGSLSVVGHQPQDREKAFRKKIALVMGQKSQLWWDIPAMDSFLLLQKYYEISDQKFKERVGMMGELLNVSHLFHIHVRKLSLGERMKLELMASLLHSPEIIFLDEPTIGLDLVAQDNIREFIRNYHQVNKTTIILTSHYMADVSALCSRLVLIANGEKAFDDSIYKFENVLGSKKSLSFTFKQKVTGQSREKSLFNNYSPEWKDHGQTVELKVDEEEVRSLTTLILEKFEVKQFGTEKLPIEKVMKEIMKNPNINQLLQN